MYPRNAASPERIAIGPVVQISDGAVQTSGVSVKVLPQGGTASASGGTVAYEEGIVHYLPTQAETNYASFILIAYKTDCIPATTTVVTSASATTGKVVLSGETHTSAVIPTVTDVTNIVTANVTQVLGSATTATFDSLSSQLSAIGSGTGAALNFAASDDNADGTVSGVTLAAVGTPTGTFSNTYADDTSNHVIASADVTGTQTITWAYGFNCGVARSASKVTWKGIMSGTGPAPDTFTFSAWNGSTWDTRLVVANSIATAQTFDIPLLSTHTTVAGLVILRITYAEADAGTLTTNLLLVQAQQSGSLVGYSDGAIWINTGASNTNTVPYIDGVADNPVSTIAAALTLSAALGLKRFRIANSSSITLGAAVDAYSLIGQNWSLALGGQSISGSYIEGATITGTATGANPPEFFNCHFVGAASAPTIPPSTLLRCGINTTTSYPLTAGSAGQFMIVDCFSEVEGSGTPYFSFPGACKINIRRWAGGTNVTLNNSAANMTIEVLAGGGQTIALGGADAEIRGICRAVTLTGVTTDSTVQIDAVTGPISIAGADGTVNIYGVCGVVTDSRTGTPLGTNSAISRVNINAEVDTAFADYDPPTNTEFEARTLVAASYFDPSTDGVNVTSISGDSTAADRLEAILDATPTGLVVDDNDPDPLATAFETNLAEATDDHYNGAFLVFTSGALLGQSRKILDYDGTSKVITLSVAFTEAPAGGDAFLIVGRSE